MQNILDIIGQCKKENPCNIDILLNEPISEHTTFKVGGPADIYLTADIDNFPAFSKTLFFHVGNAGVPVFILGGGANIVVSDKGIRGIVLDTCGWKGKTESDTGFIIRSGTSVDEACECAASLGLSGLEFLAGMPGSIGGAVWMNARCYESEIADVLEWTEIIDIKQSIITRIKTDKKLFSYKKSPFQEKDCLILTASFNLKPGDKNKILSEMEKNRKDRQEKGHYLYPCAGSAFKNNRNFGKPTGQIIDELGLKGFSVGGAQIAPFHGNIIINTGNATAVDIRMLTEEIITRVKAATGFTLEPEILFIGEN
jgi:UDP-N-acetylmuramate dehydrogenase